MWSIPEDVDDPGEKRERDSASPSPLSFDARWGIPPKKWRDDDSPPDPQALGDTRIDNKSAANSMREIRS
jgi:hypothetical protein